MGAEKERLKRLAEARSGGSSWSSSLEQQLLQRGLTRWRYFLGGSLTLNIKNKGRSWEEDGDENKCNNTVLATNCRSKAGAMEKGNRFESC